MSKYSKYKAVKTVIDGIKFDSKAEARRYQDLRLLEMAREIKGLTLQPAFKFMYQDRAMFTYKADFSYFDCETKREVIEDVKGFETPVFRLKKKLIEAQHGIKIEIIK